LDVTASATVNVEAGCVFEKVSASVTLGGSYGGTDTTHTEESHTETWTGPIIGAYGQAVIIHLYRFFSGQNDHFWNSVNEEWKMEIMYVDLVTKFEDALLSTQDLKVRDNIQRAFDSEINSFKGDDFTILGKERIRYVLMPVYGNKSVALTGSGADIKEAWLNFEKNFSPLSLDKIPTLIFKTFFLLWDTMGTVNPYNTIDMDTWMGSH